MALQIIYAPHPIFSQVAEKVENINQDIRDIIDQMLETLRVEKAVGLAGNMVGILKRIVVIDLHENDVSNPIIMINPEIIYKSEEMQEFEEASLSFPGISADISRPSKIKVKFLDYDAKPQELEAEDFLATVILHEVDYLDGKTYLHYLSKIKRDMLIKKMKKFILNHPPHIHGEGCRH